jgi:hypothetical protein
MNRESSQATGVSQARKLRRWIERTEPADIPKNQFGRANRSAICNLLSISLSTIGSNDKLRACFEEIDSRLLQCSTPNVKAFDRSNETFDVRVLAERCEHAEAEAERLRRELVEASIGFKGWRIR